MSKKFKVKNPAFQNQKVLRFIPLGGNGQVTKNMFVYEYGDDIVLVDCGMGFPTEQLYGVDMVIPDISYLRDKKQKIRGLLITHGHEDHIGAIPYLIDKLDTTIYATRLTVGLIKNKLKEVNKLNTTKIVQINPGEQIQLGSFRAEAFRVSHSIPDSVGYALTSPLGTTIHTGDYKFDWTPLDGKTTDVDILTEYGRKGVLALMSDCLRSEKPGNTLSEAAIQEKFEEVMEKASGRVIITTFASNISRVQQAINASMKFHRKVCVVGRSMENNLLTAQNLGYISIPRDLLIKQEEIERTNDKNLTLIVAGSQGQPGSALNRIANGDHRFIFIKAGDEVVFSADPIPGNQDAVYEMIDNLSRLGANVKYSDITSDFHVSGHAAQDELILMLSLTKPKYAVPISAMHRMMKQYALLAESTGVPRQNVLIVDEAGVIEFSQNGARIAGEIETENVFVDGIGVGDVGEVVLRDRKVLAEEGIVVVILTIDKHRSQIIGEPDIVSRGFVYMKQSEPLIKEATSVVKKSLGDDKKVKNWMSVKEKVTNDLERFLYQKTQRKPMVVPVIVDV
ncbi:MAG TPA: ribonuclease J [Candidatus Saccharimonadales bacterium]|nr:ribonuclease J [Candidatus Saccharimonadales bacterium]